MASGTPSEFAESELPLTDVPEGSPPPTMPSYPPFAPYSTRPEPMSPSVAETIVTGRNLRVQHKATPLKTMRPMPKPAKPRPNKVTDVKMSMRQLRAHTRCLRRHGIVLTDRLERMSKPRRRNIIYLWREHADTLPSETIARLRSMLDADEPFKPDQAYDYFINLRKTKKKAPPPEIKTCLCGVTKKDLLTVCGDKKFAWARNATVSFARGIQQRLSRPGDYELADGMLRLSDIVLKEICSYMRVRMPSRRSSHPKARFMLEMADKVAIWIDEIMLEADDRMLMMDFDEDEEEVEQSYADDSRPLTPEPDVAGSPDIFEKMNSAASASTGSVPGTAPAGTVAATPGGTTPPRTPGTSPTQTAATTPSQTAAATPSQTAAATPSQTAAATPSQTAATTPSQTAATTPSQTAAATPAETAPVTPVQSAMAPPVDTRASTAPSPDSVTPKPSNN